MAFRVPTDGGRDNYWAHPKVHRSQGGIVLSEATGKWGFTVSHEATGFALFSGVPREVADAFFEEISTWPEWRAITSRTDAQFLKTRVEEARQRAKKRKT